MNLKYILIVWGAMLFCVGCSEDDVDSSYSFDVAGLKATVTNDKGSVVEMNTILLDSLQQQGFVGEVSFSEETRAENDRLAEEKFAEKVENIKNIKPARLLQLLPGERVMVTFDYLLKRVKDGKFERNSIGQPAGVMRPGYPKEFLQEYVKQTGDRYKVPQE